MNTNHVSYTEQSLLRYLLVDQLLRDAPDEVPKLVPRSMSVRDKQLVLFHRCTDLQDFPDDAKFWLVDTFGTADINIKAEAHGLVIEIRRPVWPWERPT